MIEAIACHPPGLIGGPLSTRGVQYQVEKDGLLNPQPTPDEHAILAHYTHTFCVRTISEDRAAQLEWPGLEVDPDDYVPSVEEVKAAGYSDEVAESIVAEEQAKADGLEPEDDTDTGGDDPDDHHALDWPELRAYAKDQGVTETTKAKILAALDERATQ